MFSMFRFFVSSTLTSGFLIGGHVMRLCHGHDESLTIPGADKTESEQRWVPLPSPTHPYHNTMSLLSWGCREKALLLLQTGQSESKTPACGVAPPPCQRL